MKWPLSLCLVALALIPPAAAHPVPFSFLDFHLKRSGIEASLILHDLDVAHDLGVSVGRFRDRAFLLTRKASIIALLNERLKIVVDGKILRPQWGEPELLTDREAIRLNLLLPQ